MLQYLELINKRTKDFELEIYGIKEEAKQTQIQLDDIMKYIESNNISNNKQKYGYLVSLEHYHIYITVILFIFINIIFDVMEVKMSDLDRYASVRIKYHKDKFPRLQEAKSYGDFIDLRAAKAYDIKKGDFVYINLGVSMKLPDGYWGQVVPRSSLFKTHGLIQTNSFGVIDNDYCGEHDIWMLPVYALRDTIVEENERVCQFRIVKNNPIRLMSVETLDFKDRGGFGSTGTH